MDGPNGPGWLLARTHGDIPAGTALGVAIRRIR